MLETYEIKIKAYKYAKEKLLEQYPEFEGNVLAFLQQEVNENEFHEKSILREKINQYMSEYIEKLAREPGKEGKKQLYENFYWITIKDIENEFKRKVDITHTRRKEISEYETLMETQEYEEILQKGILQIHETPTFDPIRYYTANTQNSIEIDTYITNPNQRHAGIARILVYEGIKKHIKGHFKNEKNEEIFLCSTLHRDNLSSKYVSEFFGLKDQLFVKRRMGRDREVHICRIGREEAEQYLENMQDKLAILYGYNPENKKITKEKTQQILEEQLEYEEQEYKRINGIRHRNKDYKGSIRDLQSKAQKIIGLKEKLKEIEAKDNLVQGEDEGER